MSVGEEVRSSPRHDVNNAMAVILGNAEVIAAVAADTTVVAMAAEIVAAAERVHRLLDHVQPPEED